MERFPKKQTPDVSLTAEAKVKRLYFEKVPDTETRFWGQDEKETESGTVRENLPEESERAVVYREVSIRLKTVAEITGVEQSLEGCERRELGPGTRSK
ncbi:MAG: hypothetical protein ACFB50_00190 [Rubrobacteraceae bacterium]